MPDISGMPGGANYPPEYVKYTQVPNVQVLIDYALESSIDERRAILNALVVIDRELFRQVLDFDLATSGSDWPFTFKFLYDNPLERGAALRVLAVRNLAMAKAMDDAVKAIDNAITPVVRP